MILRMERTAHPSRVSGPGDPWGPPWATVLVSLSLVPAAWGLVLGSYLFTRGFGPEALAVVGWIAGPVVGLGAVLFAVPAILFLFRRGKPLFFTALAIPAVMLAMAAIFSASGG